MFVAEIAAHNSKRLNPEPRPLVSLSSEDIDTLMLKVDGVCAAFATKNGFAEHNLTVTIKEAGL